MRKKIVEKPPDAAVAGTKKAEEDVAPDKTEEEVPSIVQSYEDSDFLKKNNDVEEIYKEVDDVLVDVRDKSKTQKIVSDVDHCVVIQATTDVINSSKAGVRYMYSRYQTKWLDYMKKIKLANVKDENEADKALLGFFIEQSTLYAPSTLYVIYSCVNSWFIMNH